MRASYLLFLLAAPVSLAHAQSAGQTTEEINAEKDRIAAETGRINAQKDRIAAEADLQRARIASLQIPSFENKTKLNDGAGKLEATMLTAWALGNAAAKIKAGLNAGNTYLVLAGDEALDFTRYQSLRAEMNAVHILLIPKKQSPTASFPVAGAVAALKGVAGLFSAETEVTSIDLTAALPNRLLAAAVASQLQGRGRLPGSMLLLSEDATVTAATAWKDLPVQEAFARLVGEAQAAQALLDSTPKTDKETTARLQVALARYKAFFDRATTPDDKGVVPIVAAARTGVLVNSSDRVLRVYVEQAGGSLINTKNIATTFGVDPVKVSGGVIISYIATDPRTGSATEGGLLSCRSTLTSLRRVQEGKWKGSTTGDRCDVLF